MRDRESTKILPNGAVRYGVYDANGNLLRYEYIRLEDEPTVQGSLWNRANVLPDALVSLLGLPYEDPQLRHALMAHPNPIKIAFYETAGAYEWTAPDLCDGQPYKIGVLIIGGGGSGAVSSHAGGSDSSNSVDSYALGGGSGYSRHMVTAVSPGEIKNVVVGAGGPPSSFVDGAAGGTSAFNGSTASGGGAGETTTSNYTLARSKGARGNGTNEPGAFGFDPTEFNNEHSAEAPWQCFNQFERKEMLGSGGSVKVKEDSGDITLYPGGKGPDGLGGGDGGATGGEDATAPGCGGGATLKGQTSGAGADGAVYIYFLGVAAE